MPRYHNIHVRLVNERGRAAQHKCSCGSQARDWAYQYTAGADELIDKGQKYSMNMDDYLPMCRKCHLNFDMVQDPALAEARSRGGVKGGTNSGPTIKRRYDTEPAFREQAQKNLDLGRVAGAKARWEQLRADPEKGQAFRDAQERGRETVRKRLKTDPEFLAFKQRVFIENARKANTKRRTCLDCGKVSTPGGMGAHMRLAKHSTGWKEAVNA